MLGMELKLTSHSSTTQQQNKDIIQLCTPRAYQITLKNIYALGVFRSLTWRSTICKHYEGQLSFDIYFDLVQLLCLCWSSTPLTEHECIWMNFRSDCWPVGFSSSVWCWVEWLLWCRVCLMLTFGWCGGCWCFAWSLVWIWKSWWCILARLCAFSRSKWK